MKKRMKAILLSLVLLTIMLASFNVSHASTYLGAKPDPYHCVSSTHNHGSIRYYYGWTSRTSDGDYHIFYAYSWYGWGDYVGSYYSFCGS